MFIEMIKCKDGSFVMSNIITDEQLREEAILMQQEQQQNFASDFIKNVIDNLTQ